MTLKIVQIPVGALAMNATLVMDEESRDEMSEWVDVEKRYDGVVEVIIGDEWGYDFVRVEV